MSDRVVTVLAGFSPGLLAIAFVLMGFVANAVPLDQLWRPLIMAVGVAVGVQAVAVVILGSLRGSVWAFVLVCAFAGLLILAGLAILALTLFGIITRAPERQYRLGGLLAAGMAVALVAVLNAYLDGDVALLPDDLYTAADHPWFVAVPYLPAGAP